MKQRPHPCPACQRLTHNVGLCDECKQRRIDSGITGQWIRSKCELYA